MNNQIIYKEYPSGRVLCCLRNDVGAIVCLSDATDGSFEDRALQALEKVQSAIDRLNS